MLSLIAVIGKNRELGKDNKLIWNIPEDIARFRKITANHPVIMGRKTFQSIGQPLPKRTNIVITSKSLIPGMKEASIPGIDSVTIVGSLDEAIDVAKKSPGNEEIFIVGGGQVYAQAIDKADRLYLTVVDATADADTFFPDYSQFTKIISEEFHKSTDLHYWYKTLER